MTKRKTKPPARPKKPETPTTLALTADAVIEITAARGDDEGAGLPKFRMVAYTGGPMRVGGWRHPVVIDLAGLSIPSQSRPIRFSHDASAGVGHTDQIRVDDGQLVATGVISRDTATAREVVASSKNGFPWQASVGASVDEFEFVKEKQSAIVNGREFAGPLNIVRKSTLSEISFVDLGADSQTSATVAAAANKPSSFSDEETSMSINQITDGVEAGNQDDDQGRLDSKQQTPPVVPNPVQEMRAQVAAETERINHIRLICANQHPEIESKAIREGLGQDALRTGSPPGKTTNGTSYPRSRKNSQRKGARSGLPDDWSSRPDRHDVRGSNAEHGQRSLPRRHRIARTLARSGVGQRLHGPELPR